ncbi:hypothetical protein [Pelobacter propionicus]|nr:hypothetical protein [Pelobacter propionicus]
MTVRIITSCTGKKIGAPGKLSKPDLEELNDCGFLEKEALLRGWATTAAAMYKGQQHVCLMQGVSGFVGNVDLWILSAGYGLIPAGKTIVPYECTFAGMGQKKLRSWAGQLNVPGDFRAVVKKPCDLLLILLGKDYLSACSIDGSICFGGPTLLFCGSDGANKIPNLPHLRKIILGRGDATRFRSGLISLKGRVAALLLRAIGNKKLPVSELLNPQCDILSALEYRL